jgi:phage gpG-like protein
VFRVETNTQEFTQQFDNAYHQTLREAIHETLRQFAERLRSRAAQRFAAGGEGGWPPRGRPAPPPRHRRTGRLRGSLVYADHPEHIEAITDDDLPALIFGTRTPYAKFIHYGTAIMPARPLLTEVELAF